MYKYERQNTQARADNKRYSVAVKPDGSTDKRHDNRSDMIYRETNGHTWGNMTRVCDFLKKCADGDREIEKYMIKNIKCDNETCTVIESIGKKYEKHAEIFKRKHFSLAEDVDNSPNQRTKEIIYEIVEDEQKRDFYYAKMEFLNQQQHRENYEKLPTCTRQK